MSDSNNNSGILRKIAVWSAIVGLVATVLTCTKNGLDATKSGIGVTKELSTLSFDKQDISKPDDEYRTEDAPVDRPKVIPKEEIIPDAESVIPKETKSLTGAWTDNSGVECVIEQDEDQLVLTVVDVAFTGEIKGKRGTVTAVGPLGQTSKINFTVIDDNTILCRSKNAFGIQATFTLKRNEQ